MVSEKISNELFIVFPWLESKVFYCRSVKTALSKSNGDTFKESLYKTKKFQHNITFKCRKKMFCVLLMIAIYTMDSRDVKDSMFILKIACSTLDEI